MPEPGPPSEPAVQPEHAYQSLYRRYRPQRFAEVRGQDHVVLALRHAVRDDRVAHAYLFSGPRGTGKTSTARILAKALNCSDPIDGEPCGVCESCVDITRGASFDVHELDAASNNGVDAMRDLVARASLATPGRWKVYIVDEVHMLSTAASNALLKTLEEPPDHVVFVLATTDPQKVLPTIRSRTQHYEFHLLESDVLSSLLADVASDAHLELPDAAVDTAVRRGRGSARDALSVLDQVVASGVVEDDTAFLAELVTALAEGDTKRALEAVNTALVAGRDAPRLAGELLEELRAQFLGVVAPGVVRDTASAAGSAMVLGPARSVRAMEVLGAAMVAMRDALDPRTTLEVALVRLTHPEIDGDLGALLERIERLERRVQELQQSGPAAAPAPPPPPPPSPATGPSAGAKPALGAFRAAPAAAATTPPAPPATAATTPPAMPPATSRAADAPGPSDGATAPDAASPDAGAPAAPAPAPAPGPTPTARRARRRLGRPGAEPARPAGSGGLRRGTLRRGRGNAAVFALPNAAHVERAAADRGAVEAALGAHFGGPMTMRLVAESDVRTGTGGAAAAAPAPPASEGPAHDRDEPAERPSAADPAPVAEAAPVTDEAVDDDEIDPLSGEVGGDAASWAADRLLQAFPGAEEVR